MGLYMPTLEEMKTSLWWQHSVHAQDAVREMRCEKLKRLPETINILTDSCVATENEQFIVQRSNTKRVSCIRSYPAHKAPQVDPSKFFGVEHVQIIPVAWVCDATSKSFFS